MSEIKLNLIDSTTILNGTIHGSMGDYCVAALSAEPETIDELVAALKRFHKPGDTTHFQFFRNDSEADLEPYDAGIVVIDLAARVVACESTYSLPGPTGEVNYHNGQHRTDLPIFYRVSHDWLFLDSVEEYECVCDKRRADRLRNEPFDARSILFGSPLLEFIATNVQSGLLRQPEMNESANSEDDPTVLTPIAAIHAQWLLTPREDLCGKSPRDVLLAKLEFIEADLESRARQWGRQLEGPPCLSKDSYAYRFAGFGVHEWVLYYDMIRHLLNSSAKHQQHDFRSLVQEFEQLRDAWLNEPCEELEGRIPAIVIENERKRLPEAMGGRSMVVDEDCPICRMMGDNCESGLEVCFWHLDSSNMDEHFAFSTFETEKEYLEDTVERELRYREFNEKWQEHEARLARGEPVESDPFSDLFPLDELTPFALAEPELPEA
jgi:hypothetical protein